jgi:hypothetical protein
MQLPLLRRIGAATMMAVLLLSIGSAAAQQAAPALQSYDVELLIFRNLGARETPEQWSLESAAAGQRLAIPEDESPFGGAAPEAPVATGATASFPPLPAAKMKLTAVEEALRRNRSYQPLAHIGWTQPGYPRDAAKFLSVSALVPGASGLQGQIALSRGRYLHLTLDLVLDAEAAPGEAQQRYVLRQTRRMRSNERHYIDSPKFGVIALVTPSEE